MLQCLQEVIKCTIVSFLLYKTQWSLDSYVMKGLHEASQYEATALYPSQKANEQPTITLKDSPVLALHLRNRWWREDRHIRRCTMRPPGQVAAVRCLHTWLCTAAGPCTREAQSPPVRAEQGWPQCHLAHSYRPTKENTYHTCAAWWSIWQCTICNPTSLGFSLLSRLLV